MIAVEWEVRELRQASATARIALREALAAPIFTARSTRATRRVLAAGVK